MKTELKAPVKLKLITTIRQTEAETETYELWSEGTLVQKRGQTYLQYEEVQEDKQIRSTLKFGNNEAVILRNGDVKMRMPFLLHHEQNGHYNSEYGTLPIVTYTKEMQFEPHASENSGRFYLQYDLLIGGQSAGEYTLEMIYTEGK
ncbi:DUF1934 domain-containing protein [Viridibacillus sp. YIM B01967]|uniref:DUF1934 domain-containing protein n=1 Tax=Viridibacillus soli TaxID=2798301 RepID=A0ABS1H8P4_9BACL|nr:DUF1934 domain-containing protein [Viridibacillus soli]MBK3495681.1 DUF1934 domain-containing protein [Viridibacillus soli]